MMNIGTALINGEGDYMTILVVCHGNICRSPVAASVMRQHGLTDVAVAGFKPDGTRSPKKVREWLKAHNGDGLEEHRSRQLTREAARTAELILYMDGGQKARLKEFWEASGLETERGPMDSFCEPLARYLNTPSDRIGDPMFQKGDSPEFATIMAQLVEAATNFVKQRNEAPIVVAAE